MKKNRFLGLTKRTFFFYNVLVSTEEQRKVLDNMHKTVVSGGWIVTLIGIG